MSAPMGSRPNQYPRPDAGHAVAEQRHPIAASSENDERGEDPEDDRKGAGDPPEFVSSTTRPKRASSTSSTIPVTDLSQGEGGVEVEFERRQPRRFDLMVGADGVHSNARALAFGAESEFDPL